MSNTLSNTFKILTKALFYVKYDHDYGLQFLLRKVCRTLSALGREKVHQLIDEAWDLYDKETLTPEPISFK